MKLHIPAFSTEKRNCKVYDKDAKRELKVKSYCSCSAPQCSVYLHCIMTKTALPFGTAKITIADYVQA